MQKSENIMMFKAFFSSMKEPSVFIDQYYKIIEANQAFFKGFGIKRSQAIGRFCYEAIHSEKEPCSPCAMPQAVKTGIPSIAARHCPGKDSYLQIETIPIKGKKAVIEIIRATIDKEAIKKDLEEKSTVLEMLKSVSFEWADAKTSKDVFAKIGNCILKQLGYSMMWIGLVEEDGKTVMPVFSIGFEDGYLSSIKVAYNDSPYGKGPTGMCIKTCEPRIMKDIHNDPTYEPWKKEALKRGYQSSAAFPLVSKSKVIGALNIYSSMPDGFSDQQTETLKALSAHAAIAIENSMLLEKVMNSQKEWEETFDSIANPIFIHDRQYRIVRANKAYTEMAGFSFNEAIGKPYWEIFPKGDGPMPLCKVVVESGEIEPRKVVKIIVPSGEIFLSESFPLYENNEATGFVHVLTDITKITKAQEQVEEESMITTALLKLTTDVGRLLDIGAIFEEASKMVIKLISAQRTAIFLKQDESEGYRAVVFDGWQEEYISAISTLRLRKGDMPAIDLILKGEDVYIEDAKTSELISKELAQTLNLRTIVFSPFITGEGVSGAFMAEKDSSFSQKDKDILKGITSNTAVAVENARLYKESLEMASDLARRMETIRTTYEIDRTILSTLNRKDILEVATKNTQRIIPADKVITVQLNDEGSEYIYKTGVIPVGASPFLDSVVRAGRVASVPNIAMYKHPEPIVSDFMREGFGSLIALPLYTKGKKFGCIIMASKRIGAFDKDDISNGEKLTAQVAIALENAKLYEDIKELFLSIIRVMVQAIDAKSPWTKGHSERVTEYALLLAKEMGLREDEIEKLRLASLLHDIGKIGTYDVVLDKPERLTDEEFELVKKHPAKGAEILGSIKQLKDIVPIIRSHHEKIDGSGYPDKLKADEIPLLAKILCIADSFDSMTADRPYRPAPGKEYAVSELKKCSGTQFDLKAVEAFLRVIKVSQIPLP